MSIDSADWAVPLNNAALRQLPDSVARPRYERLRVQPRIVHIGVGGFNRSHLATYLDDLLSAEDGDWGEFGVGLMPGDQQVHRDLAQQDYLYGVLELDNGQQRYRVIGSLVGHVYAPESSAAVLDRLTAPECSIVSMTVTEGGYFIEDATGNFLADHPDVEHDLQHSAAPRTWLGYVAEAARRRMQSAAAPFTLLSCDNLQSNGSTARKALLAFAEAREKHLQHWIEDNVSFPNSMVDRITPRTTGEDRDRIVSAFGILDLSPVVCESFRQWVLEDEFVARRPAWENVGVQLTADVAPYEETKMRLLNGGHSCIGYPADLLGHAYIADAVNDPLLRNLLIQFMAEARQTLKPLPGIDLDSYSESIVRRFANPAIRDQVSRICSNGSAKIAKFIFPTLQDLTQLGVRPRIVPVMLAAWLHYVALRAGSGQIEDPAIENLRTFILAGGSDARLALQNRALFGGLAESNPSLVAAVQAHLDAMRNLGVQATLAQAIGKIPA